MADAKIPTPDVLFTHLEKVSKQIQDAGGKEEAKLARSITGFATKLGENVQSLITGVGVKEDVVTGLQAQLTEWATKLNPTATETWDVETTSKELDLLDAMVKLGYLNTAQQTRLEALHKELSSVKKRSRNTGPAQVIDGRPARVQVTTEAGALVANQNGNTSMSVNNLTNAAVRFAKKANDDVDIADADKKAIRDAVTRVVVNGVPIADALGFVIAPVVDAA